MRAAVVTTYRSQCALRMKEGRCRDRTWKKRCQQTCNPVCRENRRAILDAKKKAEESTKLAKEREDDEDEEDEDGNEDEPKQLVVQLGGGKGTVKTKLSPAQLAAAGCVIATKADRNSCSGIATTF